MSALRAAARRLSTKPVLRSTLCWGDTSAAWDWAARTLTLSDGATTVLAENVDGFAELWRRNQLVLRKHGVAFDWSHKALHNSVDTIDVKPRCTRVGTTSWAFASDFWDANEKERVATTRGVFVHVKSGRPEPLPDKVAAGLRELVTEDDCDDPFSAVWNLHAIEQTQIRGRRRVDGVGRPKFDSHTGCDSPALRNVAARWSFLISAAS